MGWGMDVLHQWSQTHNLPAIKKFQASVLEHYVSNVFTLSSPIGHRLIVILLLAFGCIQCLEKVKVGTVCTKCAFPSPFLSSALSTFELLDHARQKFATVGFLY